jgi:hypothetical protein
MSQLDSTLMIILLIVLGLAGVATSLWRIARGGTQALGGIASLALMGGVLVLIIFVALAFQHVSNVLGPGSSTPAFPSEYSPIPWSTVAGFGTPDPGPIIIGH